MDSIVYKKSPVPGSNSYTLNHPDQRDPEKEPCGSDPIPGQKFTQS